MEAASRAIGAHRAALEARGQNAANATTPGYARERVQLRSAALLTPAGGLPVLVGVEATGVERMTDSFVDAESRRALGAHARWQEALRVYEEFESGMGGPGDPNLEEACDALWASLQDLVMQPENRAVRAVVIQRAEAFCDAVRRTASFAKDMRHSLDGRVNALVERVNGLAEQIAKINGEILQARAAGRETPSLLDERDRLLDELAELVGASVLERPDGTVVVTAGNGVLVSGPVANRMRYQGGRLLWERTGAEVRLEEGTVAGVFEGAAAVESFLAQLDAAVRGLREAVNAVHRNGFGLDGSTGLDFFAGGALDLELNPLLRERPERIATASSPAGIPGDPSNALALARAVDSAPVLGDLPFREAVRALTVGVGTAAAGARDAEKLAAAVRDSVLRQRDQIRGVSLDEETVGMVQHQRAIEAAARYVTAVDQAIEALFEMGAVGR
ncbi:flagellar hook-associated protein FlgK [Thermanaeromonas toyohensis]|nr:flagellar hook-associated protein FlgK [Thermanaeromonas toyohensis]